MENATNTLRLKRKNPSADAKKTKITFRQKFIQTTELETELTYNEFVENHMKRFDLLEMKETDEEFKCRCDNAWEQVWKNSHNGVVILEEEEDAGEQCDAQDFWGENHDEAVEQAIADAMPDDDRVVVYEGLLAEKQKQEKKNCELAEAVILALTRARQEKSQQIARLREELLALGGSE